METCTASSPRKALTSAPGTLRVACITKLAGTKGEHMNDPREPNNDEIQEPNTGIADDADVQAFEDPSTKQEPNTGATREPNTE
jgi:hypothetical protein